MKKKLLAGLAIGLFVVSGGVGSAIATPLNLDQGTLAYTGYALGTGRGILFHADESFSISSGSLYADLGVTSYDIDIYASSGLNNYGALLASATASLGGTGTHYQTIGINYTFAANNYYLLNWTRSDNATMGDSMLYLRDFSLPIDYGVLTLLDGTQGSTTIDFANTLHGSFSLDVTSSEVPEPATMLLFGTGLAGLVGSRFRRNKK